MSLAQRFVAVLLAGFFLLGLFAYTSSAMGSDHSMSNGTTHHVCPFMGTTPGCVNILEHLLYWQNSFAVFLVEMVPLLVLLTIACAWLWLLRLHLRELSRFPLTILLIRNVGSLLPRNILQEAFSNGIIHPKTF